MQQLIDVLPPRRWAELLELGLHHEQQHQELVLMDLQHVLACNPLDQDGGRVEGTQQSGLQRVTPKPQACVVPGRASSVFLKSNALAHIRSENVWSHRRGGRSKVNRVKADASSSGSLRALSSQPANGLAQLLEKGVSLGVSCASSEEKQCKFNRM